VTYLQDGRSSWKCFSCDQLEARKTEIETAFGGRLLWQRLDERRACRIKFVLEGGYRSPEDKWEELQARQVDSMNRLNGALQSQIKTLKMGGAPS
jgi:hypothetical protein